MPDITSLGIKVDSTDVTRGTKALNELGKAGATAEKGTKKATSATDSMNKSLGSASKSITTYVSGLVSIAAATAIIVKGVRDFAAYEKGLVGVQKTTDFTAKQMDVFKTSVQGISREVPIATLELLAIAEAAGQLGVKGVTNISKFTETMGKLQLATDVVGDEGAKSIARLLTITGEGVGVIDNFGAVLVALGNNSAASESEILSLATRLGSATATFKLSANEVVGLSAGMKSLGVSSELGGTVVGKAMRKIESAINEGGAAMSLLSEMTGIVGKDLKKTFKEDAAGVFTSWLQGMGKMIDSGVIAEDILGEFSLAGDEVLATLPKMALGYKTVSDSMEIMSEEQEKATALNIEAAKAADTLDAQLVLVENITNEVSIAVGEALAPEVRKLVALYKEWWEVNDELITQDIAGIIQAAKDAFSKYGTDVATVTGLLVSAKVAQYAFNTAISVNPYVAAGTALLFLNEQLHKYNMNIGSLPEKAIESSSSIQNIIDVITGKRDWHTGALIGEKEATKELVEQNDALIQNYQGIADAIDDIQDKSKTNPTKGNNNAPSITTTGSKSSDISSVLTDPWAVGEEARLQSVEDSLMKEYELRLESTKRTSELASEIVDPWADAEEKKLQAIEDSLMKEAQLRLEAKSRNEVFTEEFVKVSNAATADIVSAVVAGEETKVAVAGIASSALTQYAIDAATTGLTPIFEALGGQIGAWVGLGAAEESTEGVGWVQKLANAGKYLVGAGAAVLAGKAVGDTFNAQGGWLGQNPGGGRVSGGPPGVDTVFGGYTDGGTTRNWLNNNEYVIDAATAEKNYDILEAMRGSKKRLFEEGGPVSDAWEPTRGINDSGFDTFWDSVIESQGDWRAAIVESIGYYAGTGAGMISGKLVGKNLFANGGPVRDRGYGFGGFISDILDPGQVFHDSDSGVAEGMMDVWAGGDPGTNAIFGQILPWIGGQAGTSYLDQATGIDPASIDWGQLWKQARDLPIVGETVERADKILYPFVRDTLTPGEYPSFGTIEDMLKGMYEGLGSELATHVSTGGASMLLGSFETGTEYVPKTGPYALHQGESVTSVPQKKEQSDAMSALVAEVKELRTSLESLGAATVIATKKTAKTLDRMYAESSEVTA